MRSNAIYLLLPALVAPPLAAQEAIDKADETNRINYTIGYQIGGDFKRQKLDLDRDALNQGIADAQGDGGPRLDAGEMQALLVDLKRRITSDMKADATRRLQEKRQDEAAKRDAGRAFLEANGKRPGVKTLPSRLQYEVVEAGTGRQPKAGDNVTIAYRAARIDGQEFDSSERQGKPATFRVEGTFPGLSEALRLMRQGAKWKLYVPEDLAYGRQGPLAHQTIVFEVELLEVTPPQAKAATTGAQQGHPPAE